MSKTNFEFLDALGQIARDKGISVETLLDALANALVAAYKRRPDAAEEAVVTIDPESGEIRVYGQELDDDGEVIREWDDTPDDFGRIAATHALGDIYAMGGLPETALAIATVPPSPPAIVEEDLFHMLKGGTEVLEAAGAVLVGGHSAEGAELALGFAVTGRTRPHQHERGRLMRKGGLKPGGSIGGQI